MNQRSQTAVELTKNVENKNVNNAAVTSDTQSTSKSNYYMRSATAVDLRRHFNAKSVYTNTSAIYVKKKFNFRATSSLVRQTPLVSNKPTPYSHIEGKKKPF